MVPTIQIDLSRPAAKRWNVDAATLAVANRLIDIYLADIGGVDAFGDLLPVYRADFVAKQYGDEVDALAAALDRPSSEVLLANLYYDALKTVLACTAFAIDTPSGPIHARNLDWWTKKRLLCESSWIVEGSGGAAVGPFSIVGWPGFIGAFSGLAPGRFAVTLNAVISMDSQELAPPVTFVLRDVLEQAAGFDEAVERLAETPIASDCILLVTGTQPGQMVVVERTCKRSALRHSENGILCATNDYRALDDGFGDGPKDLTELASTACARFDRACELISSRRPMDAAACFDILSDDGVKMAITVQHMVMQPATGLLEVRLPGSD